jgi:hypothetical protein
VQAISRVREQWTSKADLTTNFEVDPRTCCDFNNILLAIGGSAELIARYYGSNSARFTQITTIIQAVERAATLTEQLLAVGGRQNLTPRIANVNEVLRGVGRVPGVPARCLDEIPQGRCTFGYVSRLGVIRRSQQILLRGFYESQHDQGPLG